MTTLAQAMLELAKALGEVWQGTADSGTQSTLVDDDLKTGAGELAGGTLWLLSGSLSGKCLEITRHAQNTLYFASQASQVAQGDSYAALSPRRFKKRHLKNAINRAVAELPHYTKYDESLTTVADQEEYTLPTGVSDVVSVWIKLSSSGPYSEHRGWIETHDGKLRFVHHIPGISGKTIRIAYNAPHSALSADTDTLAPGVNLDRLVWEAAVHAYRSLLQRLGTERADDILTDMLNDAVARAQDAPRHRIKREKKLPTLAGW